MVDAEGIEVEDELRCIVRRLGGTDAQERWSGLETLHGFLQQNSLDEAEMMRLWKGVFYGLWLTPGTKNQFEWAKKIAESFLNQENEVSLAFWRACLLTLCKEWRGLDQYRLDKFYMLARHMLRGVFTIIGSKAWSVASLYIDVLHEAVYPEDKSIAPGLGYHFVEMFLAELREGSNHSTTSFTSTETHRSLFLRFSEILSSGKYSKILKDKIMSEIFEPLNLEVAREEGAGPPFGPSFAADLVELLKDFKEKEVADKQSNEGDQRKSISESGQITRVELQVTRKIKKREGKRMKIRQSR